MGNHSSNSRKGGTGTSWSNKQASATAAETRSNPSSPSDDFVHVYTSSGQMSNMSRQLPVPDLHRQPIAASNARNNTYRQPSVPDLNRESSTPSCSSARDNPQPSAPGTSRQTIASSNTRRMQSAEVTTPEYIYQVVDMLSKLTVPPSESTILEVVRKLDKNNTYRRPSVPDLNRQSSTPSCSRDSVHHQPSASDTSRQTSVSSNTSSRSSTARSDPDSHYNCPICHRMFLEDIYQCGFGHSACAECKARGLKCAVCRVPITDMRNYALQALVAQRTIPCIHSGEGCSVVVSPPDLESHLLECAYEATPCPVASIANCAWRGKSFQLEKHFKEKHPENRADNASEMVIPFLWIDEKFIYLINVDRQYFMAHIKVSADEQQLYAAVQMLATEIESQKWIYELHIYNKSEPKRKFQYSDTCLPTTKPIENQFKEGDCAVLPMAYARTMLCNNFMNYKLFIKKADDVTTDYRGKRKVYNRRHGCSGRPRNKV